MKRRTPMALVQVLTVELVLDSSFAAPTPRQEAATRSRAYEAWPRPTALRGAMQSRASQPRPTQRMAREVPGQLRRAIAVSLLSAALAAPRPRGAPGRCGPGPAQPQSENRVVTSGRGKHSQPRARAGSQPPLSSGAAGSQRRSAKEGTGDEKSEHCRGGGGG